MQDIKIKKILLAHLNSNGDCLYSTVIARQIKEVDYPNAHLTWAVNSKCVQSVLLNPYVNEIWEVPTAASLTTYIEWEAFVKEAERRKQLGEFDKIFYTQIIGKTTLYFDGGIRSTTYLQYPHKIIINQQPILKLSSDEVEMVRQFAERHKLNKFKNVLLIECGPDSFKSSLNPQSAKEIADKLIINDPSLAVILSSNKTIENTNEQIIDASTLSFRANAELTKYCTLFAGCSSGISWLTTTDWAKPLPKVILVNKDNYYTSSMVYDHKFAKLPCDNIIEIIENENSEEELFNCLSMIINDSFLKSKKIFHKEFKITNYKFFKDIILMNKENGDHANLFPAAYNIVKRNGFQSQPILLFLKMLIKLPIYIFKYKKRLHPLINK
jgi:hypothetical protein